jgi:hypothetical protein
MSRGNWRFLLTNLQGSNLGRYIKEKEPVKWAYCQFKRRNLLPLLKPAHDFFYHPFVQIFYQNLTFDADNPAYLSSTILGQQVYVSVEDITNVFNCPSDEPSNQFGEYPLHCNLHFTIRDQFGGVYGDDRRTCAKRAHLPYHLLLVDSVLKKNVCPLGHKTQRIGDVLAALYAFHKKYWVNIPQLIWKQMHKYWEDMVEIRLSSASQRPLPFACLITKLIIDNGIPVPERALLGRKIPVFGLA